MLELLTTITIYWKVSVQISIPPPVDESKPIYTPLAVGATGLPVPVNEPVLPIMFPAAVIVPDVVILFREREKLLIKL